MTTQNKGTRGGRRPGAGRKAKWGEPTETIAIRLPTSLLATFVAQARSEGCTLGRLLESMLLERASRNLSAAATEKS